MENSREEDSMDEQAKVQDTTRRHESTRRGQEPGRETMRNDGRFSAVGVETMGAWGDAGQRAMAEMVELSAGAAKEGLRLYAEFQRSGFELLRMSQGEGLRWQAVWLQWYQQAFEESLQSTVRMFRVIGGNVEALTQSLERLQGSAEQAGRQIHESFTTATNNRMRGSPSQAA
jgi:hypothetical protein